VSVHQTFIEEVSQKQRVNISGMNWMNSRVEKYRPKSYYPGLLSRAGCNRLPKDASVLLSRDPEQRGGVPALLPGAAAAAPVASLAQDPPPHE